MSVTETQATIETDNKHDERCFRAHSWFVRQLVPAQVHREVILHQALLHHVVEDRLSPRGSQAGEGQTQNTVSLHVSHEGSLALAQSKRLVRHLDTSNLTRMNCRQFFKVFYMVEECG